MRFKLGRPKGINYNVVTRTNPSYPEHFYRTDAQITPIRFWDVFISADVLRRFASCELSSKLFSDAVFANLYIGPKLLSHSWKQLTIRNYYVRHVLWQESRHRPLKHRSHAASSHDSKAGCPIQCYSHVVMRPAIVLCSVAPPIYPRRVWLKRRKRLPKATCDRCLIVLGYGSKRHRVIP